jgi:two-component system response regulator GlrR
VRLSGDEDAKSLLKGLFSELTSAAMDQLELYDWPGNVRELENCVRYLTCMQLGRPIEPADLPLLDVAREPAATRRVLAAPASGIAIDRTFQDAKRELVDDFERRYLEEALKRSRGNIARAARDSGKDRRAFFELMRKHGLDDKRRARDSSDGAA